MCELCSIYALHNIYLFILWYMHRTPTILSVRGSNSFREEADFIAATIELILEI